MKSRSVCEFQPSPTTESDSGSGPENGSVGDSEDIESCVLSSYDSV